MTLMKNSSLKIVFYDGDCGLCQRSVAFLARRDRKKILRFAPLNGFTYQQYFKQKASMDTVLFLDGERVFEKSLAIIECLHSLGGANRLVGLLKLLPDKTLNCLYDHIAIHRKKLSCSYIKTDERFLN